MIDILVAEDSETIQLILRETLEKREWRVYIVQNADLVVSSARDLLPDVIVLNHMLPGRDGFRVLKDLKSDDLVGATPVMVLTDSDSPASVREGLASGADDYMLKPFDPDELAIRVGRLARRVRTDLRI